MTLIGSSLPASASVRIETGGQLPYYSRAEPGVVLADGDLAMVYFYRPISCIPEDFNLLDFFDIAAFECNPPTVDGYEVWENGPGIDIAPDLVALRGNGAVPVWFVDTDSYVTAIADGHLTIGELQALEPLVGTATRFSERLEPFVQLVVRMSGELDDGRTFSAFAHEVAAGAVTRIRIG